MVVEFSIPCRSLILLSTFQAVVLVGAKAIDRLKAIEATTRHADDFSAEAHCHGVEIDFELIHC